jgi:hypothetical protein
MMAKNKKAEKVELVSQTEFAKRVGVSQARISRLCSDGKLNGATHKDGARMMIDVKKGIELLKSALDPSYTSKIRKTVQGKSEDPEREAAPAESQKVKPVMDYGVARTLNEQYKAAIRKLEYEEKTGKLVDAASVKESAFSLGRRIRDSMLNIPDRIASMLAAETDETKIRELLTGEIRNALEELSKNNA